MKKIFILMMVLMLILTSCGKYKVTISEKEETVGSTMLIVTKDDNLLHKFHGNKIKISSNDNSQRYRESQPYIYGHIDKLYYETNENSAIVYNDDIKLDYDFSENNTMTNKDKLKLINEIKNKSTYDYMFIVESQQGTPLLVFSGNQIENKSKYPENKHFYRFTIDNKEIILYNVIYEVFEKSLIE